MGRWGMLVGVVAIVASVVAAGVVVASSGGGDEDEGVVLEPAGTMSPGAFFDDLDLYPAEERALADPVEPEAFDAFAELEEPAALAGWLVRAFEPGLYSGTHDRPPCDLEAMAGLVGEEGRAGATTVDSWYGALGVDMPASERDNYLDDLTPVRLRFDTRVTSHRIEEGQVVTVQSLLQAGTAVLVDESGKPRVRCAGGHPLDEPEPAPELDGDAALDLAELGQNPDDAWDGIDPASVVVVDGAAPQEHFDLADPADGSLFRRPAGSDGTRDQTIESPEDQPNPCAAGCRVLTISVAAVEGTPVNLHYDPTAGTQPIETTETELHWRDGRASPGLYRFNIDRDYELYLVIEEPAQLEDPLTYDNPAYDNEELFLDLPNMMQCIPGAVTITITVDGVVAQTIEEQVGCEIEGRTFEYTLE